jgi:uncharacterized protein (DUF427 family)
LTRPTPNLKKSGQESVWDFPRPAIAEQVSSHLKIVHHGVIIAETRRSVRTLETSHPPTYYFPREDIALDLLSSSNQSSQCEWKGIATYFDASIKGEIFRDVAWSYPKPTKSFQMLTNYIAFYCAPFDNCWVDGEKAVPQPGQFYGGWITSKLAGPFKGIPGSQFW